MKKMALYALAVILVFAICGCEMDNTPVKKVETLLTKYQTLDDEVLKDLNNTLKKDKSLSANMRKEYREFMKKHYRNLIYEIKDDKIDGDMAVVTVEITVQDYSDIASDATAYRINNEEEFLDENGNYKASLFTKYRLDRLKEAKDNVTYTIEFNLKKQNNEWVVENLSREDMSKINGLYEN